MFYPVAVKEILSSPSRIVSETVSRYGTIGKADKKFDKNIEKNILGFL